MTILKQFVEAGVLWAGLPRRLYIAKIEGVRVTVRRVRYGPAGRPWRVFAGDVLPVWKSYRATSREARRVAVEALESDGIRY